MSQEPSHYRENLNRARAVGGNNLALNIIAAVGEWIANRLVKTAVTPNQVTTASLIFNVLGAMTASLGTSSSLFWASLWFFFAYALDCADGRLSRKKNLASPVGGYWDNTCDDLSKFVITLGLMAGVSNAGYGAPGILAPLFILFSDILSEHTMTRYRIEILDRMPEETNFEEKFQSSLLLNAGRNLLPPINLRTLIFPAFAVFGLGFPFLFGYAFFTVLMTGAFVLKVYSEIQNRKS